jgi:hypothetical protein
MKIPEICVKWFSNRFAMHPSIIDVEPPYNEKLYNKITSLNVLWFNKKIGIEGGLIWDEYLIEYDVTGIFIYKNKENKLFILTTPDRKSVAEFTVHNLKTIK